MLQYMQWELLQSSFVIYKQFGSLELRAGKLEMFILGTF